MKRRILLLCVVMLTVGCVPTPPGDSTLPVVTLIPTVDMNSPQSLCTAVGANWARNWPRVVVLLEQLAAMGAECPAEPATLDRLYNAYLVDGDRLAENGDRDAALVRYEAAQALFPDRMEASAGLHAMGVFTPEPPPACAGDVVQAALDAVPAYLPVGVGPFITADGRFLMRGETLFPVQGVNYTPLYYPSTRFLLDAPLDVINAELDLIQIAGFNTLRILLQDDLLFQCPSSGAVPVPAAFDRLDALIRLAAERDLYVIPVLHHNPDLLGYPLYDAPDHSVAQTRYLVERYREEPAILAWDLRDGGDADYDGERGVMFSREAVLTWLAGEAERVRAIDGNHLLTAGWSADAGATIPYVDVISLQHWDNAVTLRQRIATLREYSDKPVLLAAFGYSTFGVREAVQGQLLQDVIQAAEFDGVAGWMVWTAFDVPLEVACMPPACPAVDNAGIHYGLWTTEYQPKIALGLVRIAMYDPQGEAPPQP